MGDGTEKAEFGEWSWIPPEKVIELVSICDYYDIFNNCPNQLRFGAGESTHDLAYLLCAGSGFQEACLQGSPSSVCSISPIISPLLKLLWLPNDSCRG